MNDLATINASVSSLDPATPFVDVVNVLGLIVDMKGRLDDLRRQAEAVAVEQLGDGSVTIGDVRYYAAPTRTHKCRDLRHAVDVLLTATAGDVDALVDCLSSGALKPGETRRVLDRAGVAFADVFETVESTELREGKPAKVKRLQAVNERFIK